MPISLHTISQLHPQFSLLLGRHGLPALLDAGEGRVGNSMLGRGASLLAAGEGLDFSLRTSIEGGQRGRSSAVGAESSRGNG